MAVATTMVILNLLVILAVLVGGIFLQIFLSKREGRWLGLILPILTFAYSLLAVLNVINLDTMTKWEIFSALGATFLLSNIPTILLLAIYFACKEKNKRKKQLEKMNIQDLD